MKLTLFAYSKQGCVTARRIRDCFPEAELRAYAPARLEEPDFTALCRPAPDFYGQQFAWADTMIFVGACGIAVRQIAPWVRDKTTDPAVLCVDELAKFVIPILSGHIGGANALARYLEEALGAQAVITTATDINRRFSVDAWAAERGLIIDSMALAKRISAQILERDLPLWTELPVSGDYPAGTYPGKTGDLGISVGYTTEKPFRATLRLIPKCLHLGIGCRRGTEQAAIEEAVGKVLTENGLDLRAVRCAASVTLKADEPGLLAWCREREVPIRFYSPEALMALPGEFSRSDFVRKTTGVDCVCERSAMMGAETLLVKKTACNGVTVAVAAERYEVSFG